MTDPRAEQLSLLRSAEVQFRLATAVRLATSTKRQPIDLPLVWTHGQHTAKYSDLCLLPDEADYGAYCLHRSATFLMASAALEAIRTVHPNPKTHGDADIVAAYQISRMVRNAFAHSPFAPIWRIDPDCKNQIFEIPGVIRLDTSGIDGVHFDWRHYGGPLALLSLAEFVRITILADPSPPSQVVPLPSRFYYQQGDLILERLPPNHSAEPGSE